jgi:RNA polymerase sigma factor (sigma-70 family)
MESEGSSPSELGIGDGSVVGSSVFEEFFRAEQRQLHQALFAITGSRPEAEDVEQEAFLRLWERWDRVSELEDPVGYLHRTAINVFRDRSRRLLLAMRRAVGAAPRPDEYDAVEARSVAASVLGQLPPRQRAAIVLTERLGYSDRVRSLCGRVTPWGIVQGRSTCLRYVASANGDVARAHL